MDLTYNSGDTYLFWEVKGTPFKRDNYDSLDKLASKEAKDYVEAAKDLPAYEGQYVDTGWKRGRTGEFQYMDWGRPVDYVVTDGKLDGSILYYPKADPPPAASKENDVDGSVLKELVDGFLDTIKPGRDAIADLGNTVWDATEPGRRAIENLQRSVDELQENAVQSAIDGGWGYGVCTTLESSADACDNPFAGLGGG